ncbi:unnamed protein product [Lota lota]
MWGRPAWLEGVAQLSPPGLPSGTAIGRGFVWTRTRWPYGFQRPRLQSSRCTVSDHQRTPVLSNTPKQRIRYTCEKTDCSRLWFSTAELPLNPLHQNRVSEPRHMTAPHTRRTRPITPLTRRGQWNFIETEAPDAAAMGFEGPTLDSRRSGLPSFLPWSGVRVVTTTWNAPWLGWSQACSRIMNATPR